MSKSRNTLLNYFGKTPPGPKSKKKTDVQEEETENRQKIQKKTTTTTQKRRAAAPPSSSSSSSGNPKKKEKKKKPPTPPTTPVKKAASRSSSSTTSPVGPNEGKQDELSSLLPGDLVWAKVEGWPMWPGIICDDPDTNRCFKGSSSRQVHVHFFDTPPSRAWVKQTLIKKFTGSNDTGIPRSFNAKWRKACEQAERALPLNHDDRLSLATTSPPGAVDVDVEEEAEESVEIGQSSSDTESEKKAPIKPKHKSPIEENGNSKKRRRVVETEDSDDSDAYKPEHSDASSESGEPLSDDKSDVESDGSEEETPKKKSLKRKLDDRSSASKSKAPAKANFTPVISNIKQKLLEFSSSASSSPKSPSVEQSSVKKSSEDKEQQWAHLGFEFIKDEKIKDSKGRNKQHPDYDPSTLFVPDGFKRNLTPGMRQWWDLKSQHYDAVLFFKLGKFYELYHMDAVLGVAELGLTYMKGEFAHSGFPEISYGRYASSLITKGFKVARVEQTETPGMMEERCKKLGNPTKFDKVVKREICRITSRGTRTNNFLDGDLCDAESSYFLVLTEKHSSTANTSIYGVCFVDTSVGKFFVGQFEDDCHYSRFRTLISHYAPVQILFDKGALTAESHAILKSLNNVLLEGFSSKHRCWNNCLKKMAEKGYFTIDGEVDWPDAVATMLSESDSIGCSAKDEYLLAIQALSGCIWYLSECQMEQELLTLRKFEEYKPMDHQKLTAVERLPNSKHMILDGVTLSNLDVILNSETNSLDGTLLQKLDQCSSPFGKRLFRRWLCSPLCNRDKINDRLDAVDDLLENKAVVSEAKDLIKTLPDLERLLSRIHSQGLRKLKSHPDSRAVFYEEETYSRRKIEALLSALAGFKTCVNVVDLFSKCSSSLTSKLLKRSVTSDEDGGAFPDLQPLLDFFDNAFDHEKAKKDGKVSPTEGVNEDYDAAVTQIKELNQMFDEYLAEQSKHFGCKVVYYHSGRNRFQLEIPDSAAKKASSKYEVQGSKKGYKRYQTSYTRELLGELVSVEDKRDATLQDSLRHIFATFDNDHDEWQAAVDCLAVLDVLMNLAENSSGDEHVRPQIVAGKEPFIEVRNGSHPVLAGDQFIPNDTVIGSNEEIDTSGLECPTDGSFILVTGPNMGGKSTLMRQIGLIVIMAQVGCYVPAKKCRLTPVDRVFTRVGARDRIMSGESTLFVELNETASILQHATKHSLVLMDELGRGTATFDGTAVAYAVVKHIATNVQCRTFFSTHYHSLIEDFLSNPVVTLGHMACMVEDQNEDDPTMETVTFLYKFVSGACPKSYGFNTAKLANIPAEIIRNGYKKAKELEETTTLWNSFRTIMMTKEFTEENLKKMLPA